MSDEIDGEELELMRMRRRRAMAMRARSSKAAPPEPEEPGRIEAFARGAGQGASLGFGDEIWGGLRAIGDSLPESLGGDSRKLGFMDHYRRNRNSNRAGNAAADKAHGGYYLGGNVAGGLAMTPFMPGGAAKSGATLLQALGRGALSGAKVGAAAGFGGSNSEMSPDKATLDSALGAAGDTALGAGVGATLGGVLPVVGAGARKAGDLLRKVRKGGYVVPTPEAQRLAAEGVDLTLGQMDPRSTMGRLEELASGQATGGSVANARARSATSARDMLLRKAGMPGAKPPTSGAPVAEQLDEIGAGFAGAYDDALSGQRLSPETYLGKGKWRGLLTDETIQGAAKTKGAFESAAMARDIDASPEARQRALNWLTNEAESLRPAKSGPGAGTVEAKSIQALRTRLRDKIRGLKGEGDDRQLREIYERSEEFVSELLDGGLPADKASTLRTADASYRNKLAIEQAADGQAAFRNNREFSPMQLLEAIRKRGATPDLEGAARDAHSALTATYPMTGMQAAANEAVPFLKKAGPAWAAVANASPRFKAHALGQGSLPWWGQAPVATAQGVAGMADLASRDPARDALIRALLRAQSSGLPMDALASEE